jgi:hypothetical protein
MPRQTINDITPPKRTIRDIPVPVHRRSPERSEVAPPPPPPPPLEEMKRRRRFRFPKGFSVIIGIVVIVLIAFLARELFAEQATITVTQKKKTVSIDGIFIAKKDAGQGELSFETVSASKDGSKTVPATGEKQVEIRASGTIVIYNNYSTASQRLIKNTRFETSDGRIYRIDQSITVPGKDKTSGTPGSIEALVYADAAGTDYNIGLSDFTIPGFKGDPRYSKFYGRSKTTMTGGFIGKIETASPQDLSKAKNDLEASLRDDLTKNIEAQVPEGYLLFDSAVYIDFETVSPADSNGLKETATAYGVFFSDKKFSRSIASASLGDYDQSDVLGDNLKNIVFTPIPAGAKPWQTGALSFSLKGTTTLTWLFDQEKLKADLVGQQKDKGRIATILQAYPSIDHAEVIVKPFWRQTLPDDPKKISIKIPTSTSK